jgi:leucyl aminopeptidase
LGLAELKKMGMNGILAVNQGSVTPPALIVLEHGKEYKEKGTVCLVGKGVTFDTGGISIKPSKGMEEMKYDKSGAIAVVATMGLVADLKLPLHIVGLAPSVENNVANDPQRPGDIIRMYNGKTVEVMNTDAEGRLILADALSYCEEFKPVAIIDAATLTGMCHHTFGDKTCGILGTDQKLIDAVQKAGETVGERCWQLPLWEEYGESIKSHHSDLKNTGDGYAGTITAAMFLKEFVPEKTPWVHLDIAGTACCTQNRFDCQKGATGFGVRLFAELLLHWSSDNISAK